MRHLIEVVHSRFGLIKLEVEQDVNGNGSMLTFYYPSGWFMGEWDSGIGGSLGWPHEEDDEKRREQSFVQRNDLVTCDERSYLELEWLLYNATRNRFPDHFDRDLEVVPDESRPHVHQSDSVRLTRAMVALQSDPWVLTVNHNDGSFQTRMPPRAPAETLEDYRESLKNLNLSEMTLHPITLNELAKLDYYIEQNQETGKENLFVARSY